MTIQLASDFLFWCTAINYGLLLVWSFAYWMARQQLHRVWSLWFPLSAEQFDRLGFVLIGVYKVGILLFNLIPFIALQLAR
jgi:hypothetical protein